MTYEKMSQKKKAQMNLENCRYEKLRQPAATLDSTQKQCSERLTDGEELRNSSSFSVASQHCSIAFACHQGHVASRWLVVLPLAWNLGTVRAFGLQI